MPVDLDGCRVDLTEDLAGAPDAGFRERIHPDLPCPSAQPRVPGVEEPLGLEGFQRPRDVAAEQAGAFRDPGLGPLPSQFVNVPERMEVEEDALRRGELHGRSDAVPFT